MTTLPTAGPASDRRTRFETITTPFIGALHRAALYWARDPADADDLVQETYLRAYRTFDNFRDGTNAKAWLLTIAYSIFVNVYRKRQRAPHTVSIDELEDRHPSLIAPPSDRADAPIDRERAAAEIDRVLASLPDEFRWAVVLVDVQELSYEEAAQALACPVNTLRSRLHRGRKLLLAAFAGHAARPELAQRVTTR